MQCQWARPRVVQGRGDPLPPPWGQGGATIQQHHPCTHPPTAELGPAVPAQVKGPRGHELVQGGARAGVVVAREQRVARGVRSAQSMHGLKQCAHLRQLVRGWADTREREGSKKGAQAQVSGSGMEAAALHAMPCHVAMHAALPVA
jgi:hypothetical protein